MEKTRSCLTTNSLGVESDSTAKHLRRKRENKACNRYNLLKYNLIAMIYDSSRKRSQADLAPTICCGRFFVSITAGEWGLDDVLEIPHCDLQNDREFLRQPPEQFLAGILRQYPIQWGRTDGDHSGDLQ